MANDNLWYQFAITCLSTKVDWYTVYIISISISISISIYVYKLVIDLVTELYYTVHTHVLYGASTAYIYKEFCVWRLKQKTVLYAAVTIHWTGLLDWVTVWLQIFIV